MVTTAEMTLMIMKMSTSGSVKTRIEVLGSCLMTKTSSVKRLVQPLVARKAASIMMT